MRYAQLPQLRVLDNTGAAARRAARARVKLGQAGFAKSRHGGPEREEQMRADFNWAGSVFRGANLLLFLGDRLAVLQRDDKPDIPWPGYWDLPGGLREVGESPEACVLRETREELSIHLTGKDLSWSRVFQQAGHAPVWMFAAHVAQDRTRELALGDEGQGWDLWTPQDYLAHPTAIPTFKPRLEYYLARANS